MKNYSFSQTNEFSEENVKGLIFIENVFAVNNGFQYATETFATQDEAKDLANYLNEKAGNDKCYVVPVSVYENNEGDTFFFHN